MFPCEGWEQGWAWLYRPVSHTEERNETWVDPELAYDGDCATAGHVILDGSDPRLDSCFIRWFFDSVEAEGLRFKASITGEEGSVYAAELYATVDGNRVTLYPYQEGTLQLGKLWEFPKGILTEVGLDIGCSTETKIAVIIYEVAAGGKGCCFAGPLAPVCNIFCEIGDWFADLADDIEPLFAVGPALSAPFRSLADTLNSLGGTCCEVSANLQEILDLLEGGISWGEISAMILGHWPGLAVLLDNPAAYITEIVSGLLPELPDWLDDPAAYITEIVSGLLPELPDWLDDPLAWLTDMLEENFPLLYYLVVDPGGWLLYVVGEAFGLEPYEAQDWDFVVKALFERYFPELYLLWREMGILAGIYEHGGWEGLMAELKSRFYGLAEHALRYLWEGEW